MNRSRTVAMIIQEETLTANKCFVAYFYDFKRINEEIKLLEMRSCTCFSICLVARIHELKLITVPFALISTRITNE